MDGPTADALATFRRFNYEHIYMRDESVTQGDQVIRVLRGLVDRYAATPSAIPDLAGAVEPWSETAVRAAVTYVGGMTDRYAFDTAVTHLGWDPAALPRGIDFVG
jgi:dGTPase